MSMNYNNNNNNNNNKFDDEILMSISFKNEKDIENLKQSSYFMSIWDKKIMNEIMNSLVVKEQI